jgi:serine/threonine protein phosphatase PrpC
MMKLIAKSFMTHKHAESPDDCQDYSSQDDEKRRYAVADGATQSFFARVWAELLVEHFCETGALSLGKEKGKENWKEWLRPIQKKWYEEVEARVAKRRLFYLVNPFNAKEPALSTFIGLEFNTDNRKWQAMIIGDSCLFHFRTSQFTSYLIKKSGDFSNRTEAFASYEKDNLANPTFESGDAEPGDIFVLATDALAKWILEHEEAEQRSESLSKLTSIKSEEQFNDFVVHARTDERIRLVDDDVTLLIITI